MHSQEEVRQDVRDWDHHCVHSDSSLALAVCVEKGALDGESGQMQRVLDLDAKRDSLIRTEILPRTLS